MHVAIIAAPLDYKQSFINDKFYYLKQIQSLIKCCLVSENMLVLEDNIAWPLSWNLYSLFVLCRSLLQKLMITQEH